jgi:tungstate transport system substrate-binding protein
MGPTLVIANEMAAYTLVDEGTWLALRARLPNLKVVIASDPLLENPYAILIPESAWKNGVQDPVGRAAHWLWNARAAIANGFVLHGVHPLRPAP